MAAMDVYWEVGVYKSMMMGMVSRCFAALRVGLGGLLLCGAGGSWAGFITDNEAGLDAIFSQSGFGSSTIDARFNAPLSVANSALLSIDSDAEFSSLSSLSVFSPPKTINLFFVDTITFCGVAGSFIGCSSTPGNVIVVSSSFAAGAQGAILEAHEIGHNLGLDHVAGSSTNLMNPIISSNSSLTASQITSILGSSLVQVSAGQRFLSITPIAVVASVPEPQTWAMLSLGLLGVIGWVRRRKACAI